MDFSWSEEQLTYKKAAIHFAQQELSTQVPERDRQELFPRDLWRKCVEFGVLGLPFPETYGGTAADILRTMLVFLCYPLAQIYDPPST